LLDKEFGFKFKQFSIGMAAQSRAEAEEILKIVQV